MSLSGSEFHCPPSDTKPAENRACVKRLLADAREADQLVTYRSKNNIVIPQVPAMAVDIDSVDTILAIRS